MFAYSCCVYVAQFAVRLSSIKVNVFASIIHVCILNLQWDSSVKLWDSTLSANDKSEDEIPSKRVRRSARIAARKRTEAERNKPNSRLHQFTDEAGPSV